MSTMYFVNLLLNSPVPALQKYVWSGVQKKSRLGEALEQAKKVKKESFGAARNRTGAGTATT